MNLPGKVVLHQEKDLLMIEKSHEGFEVKISGTWGDYVIYNRALSRYLLKEEKIRRFQLVDKGNGLFELKNITFGESPHLSETHPC